jgi:hypothetical protein
MNIMKRFVFILALFFFIGLSLIVPHSAKAFSFQQTFKPVTSLLITVRENIQYVFAFTPTSKVKVLESQAQRRLANAQNEPESATDSIRQYQDIKSRQNQLLGKVDNNTLNQIQIDTVSEQQTLAKIGNTDPTIGTVIKTVNTNVVNGVKNIVTLKEGTTAGEAFDKAATITYAPGTSGQGTGGLIIVGDGQNFAPGTSGTGTGGTTIQGGGSQFAPGTSGGTGTGGTTVEGNNPSVVGGSGESGTGGNTVSGSNPGVVGGDSGGGAGTQTVVGQ